MSGEATFSAAAAVDLLEWKHSIFELYAGIRAATDPEAAWRTVAVIEDAKALPVHVPVSTGQTLSFTRIGIARFVLHDVEHALELTWNDGYGGGLFLAFIDETSGTTTYGGGRYLIDTVKGADLGFDRESGTAVLDFNFAFNPSCSYDARWACPLAPSANRLAIPVTAGEQHQRSPLLAA